MKKRCWVGLGLMLLVGIMPMRASAEVFMGRVLDDLTGEGLVGAEILSTAGGNTQTVEQGRFALESDLPDISVRMPGFQDLSFRLNAQAENIIRLQSAEVMELTPVEVKARADREQVVVSKQSLQREAIKRTTATLFPDVAKVIQLLPGVTTSNDFSSLLYVRGGSPDEVLAVLDDMVILNPYIWGGIISVFNPNLVENVEFFTGGFSAEWPQAMSAVIQVKNKVGNPEKYSGFLDLSAATLDFFVEGPCWGPKDSSFLFGLRRTHYDLIIKLLANDNQIYPYFYDGQLKLNFPMPSGALTVNTIFSLEGMEFLMKPEEDYGSKEDTSFHYQDRSLNTSVAYRHDYSDDVSMLTLMGLYYNSGGYKMSDPSNPFDVTQERIILQLRNTWQFLLGDHQVVRSGFYFFPATGSATVKATTRIPLPPPDRYYEATIDEKVTQDWLAYTGMFVQDDMEILDKFLYFSPSANLQYFTLNRQWMVNPRAALKTKLNPAWDVYVSTGLFSQYPLSASQLSEDGGNPNLQAEEAVHYVAGTKLEINPDFFLQVEGFYKDYRKLIISDPDPDINYSNNELGHAFGGDLIFQKKLGGKWDGWLTYSYVKSERRIAERSDPLDFDKPRSDVPIDVWYPASSERPHTVNLILNYNFSEKWQLALTQKYSSGKPYTPIVGAEYNPATDEYIPVYSSAQNSARMPDYMTTDVKLSMPLGEWENCSAYIQITNLFDIKNVDSYQYKNDYSEKRPIYQLPRIFFGGVKVEF